MRLKTSTLGPAAPALLTAAIMCCGAGCGGAGSKPVPSNPYEGLPEPHGFAPHARAGYLKLDGDADNDDSPHPVKAEPDALPFIRQYGPLARPDDARAIASLVKRYYVASAAENATLACSLMYSGVREVLASQQGAYRDGPNAACTRAFAPLLAQQHQRLLSEEPATMTVIAVHVDGNLGLAVLGFRHTPESQIVVEREGHTWRVDALFGAYMS